MAGHTVVAKKQSKKSRPPRDVIKQIRVTQEWSDAFDRLIEHCNRQSPLAEVRPGDIFGVAIAEYAAKVGFPESFPKR